MDPPVPNNSESKEYRLTSADESGLDPDVRITIIPSNDSVSVPTIIIDPSSNENDLTVTPAFPSFPTDEEVVIKPESLILLEPSNNASDKETNSLSLASSSSSLPTSPPTQQNLQLLDELKYLLKSTNSLASPEADVQASQEADSAIHRRTLTVTEDQSNNFERFLIEGLTPSEAKSLGAAERRSIASRGHRSSTVVDTSDRSRSRSMQSSILTRSNTQLSPTILIAQPEHRTFVDHLSGLIWAVLAAYAFSIIIFLTKTFGIDLIFAFFLQMIVQTLAFAIYAFYKSYNLLGPIGHRIAMISRGFLIGIGVLTSFLAYYYITLPELSSIRQIQVVLTIILSIFFLHERITISRIISCILTIIAIILFIRPTTFGTSSHPIVNLIDYKTSWIPYISSSWNSIIGIILVLCTVITFSIASIMNKIYFSTQHLHNTVLCFWSALFALLFSMILVYLTHFAIKNVQPYPHDWRLFVGIGLAIASIFVFIANQKAIKRERSSIVTLIYSTDIILAFILQNLFTRIKSDIVVILGCILILSSIFIICVEVLLIEKRKRALAIKVAQIANTTGRNFDIQKSTVSKPLQKRLSI